MKIALPFMKIETFYGLLVPNMPSTTIAFKSINIQDVVSVYLVTWVIEKQLNTKRYGPAVSRHTYIRCVIPHTLLYCIIRYCTALVNQGRSTLQNVPFLRVRTYDSHRISLHRTRWAPYVPRLQLVRVCSLCVTKAR